MQNTINKYIMIIKGWDRILYGHLGVILPDTQQYIKSELDILDFWGETPLLIFSNTQKHTFWRSLTYGAFVTKFHMGGWKFYWSSINLKYKVLQRVTSTIVIIVQFYNIHYSGMGHCEKQVIFKFKSLKYKYTLIFDFLFVLIQTEWTNWP